MAAGSDIHTDQPIQDLHSEHRGLLRDGLLNSLSFVVSMIAGIVVVPALLAGLGSELYGIYVAALALQYAITLSAGLGRSVSREVAARHGTRDELLNEFVSLAGAGYLIFGLVGAAVIALLGVPLSASLHLSPSSERIARIGFALTGLAFLGDQVAGFATEVLTGMRRFVLMNLVSSGTVVVRTMGILVILRVAPSILAILIWHGAVSVAMGVITLSIVLLFAPEFMPRFRSFQWRRFTAELQFSMASQITSWLNALLWRSGQYVVGFARGSAAIAPYDIGQRFPTVLINASWQAAEVLYPAASQHTRHNDPKRYTSRLLTIGTRWLFLMVLPVCIALWFVAPRLIQIWLSGSHPDAALVLRVGTLIVLADIVAATSVQVLWAQGALNRILKVTACAAATCIILSVLLLKYFGVVGPAIALLVSISAASVLYCGMACVQCGLSARTFWRETLHDIPIAATAEVAVFILALRYVRIETWFALLLWCMIAVCVYAAVFFVAGTSPDDKALLREVMVTPRQLLRQTRLQFERVPLLRPLVHLVMEVRAVVHASSNRNREEMDSMHAERIDPFRSTSALEQVRFDRGISMVDSVRNGQRFGHALEVGCSEGYFTELLARRCTHLEAVDISAIALERAKQRCRAHTNVDFTRGDIRTLALSGPYDIVTAVGVLEYIRRPAELIGACETLVSGIKPGGYLLVGSTLTENQTEATLIGRLLIRGTQINRWFERNPKLELVTSAIDDCICRFEHTLLRRRLP